MRGSALAFLCMLPLVVASCRVTFNPPDDNLRWVRIGARWRLVSAVDYGRIRDEELARRKGRQHEDRQRERERKLTPVVVQLRNLVKSPVASLLQVVTVRLAWDPQLARPGTFRWLSSSRRFHRMEVNAGNEKTTITILFPRKNAAGHILLMEMAASPELAAAAPLPEARRAQLAADGVLYEISAQVVSVRAGLELPERGKIGKIKRSIDLTGLRIGVARAPAGKKP